MASARPVLRRLRAVLAPALVAGLLATAAPATADPAGRRLVGHTVRAGETVTGLAVRYHAWTDELLARNHLDRAGHLTVGQHLVIPVVRSAARHHHVHHPHAHAHHHAHHHAHGRAGVRRAVARAAVRHGVDPQLALAVAWQESGWRMGVRSSAGAVGAMQVLPSTGTWMSLYEGRPLRLHRLRDNAAAGTRLLALLTDATSSTRRAVAAYYQGLGAVHRHGVYAVSRPYVRSVLAIRSRLEHGRPPA
ncbi:MAG: transglycosylase SLT domain-containing protein [Nocardioides sp.]